MIFMVLIGEISPDQGTQCRRLGYIPPISKINTSWSCSLYCILLPFLLSVFKICNEPLQIVKQCRRNEKKNDKQFIG